MTWSDHSRRAATVLLVALCLLLVPAVAQARFTSTRSPQLAVGSATMAAPSGITGSYACSRRGNTESITVTVTSFTAGTVGGRTPTAYGFGVAFGNQITSTSVRSTSTSQTLSASAQRDKTTSTWTVGVRSYYQQWSSPIATANITCAADGNGTGSL